VIKTTAIIQLLSCNCSPKNKLIYIIRYIEAGKKKKDPEEEEKNHKKEKLTWPVA
jgi:hypothetical protein